MTSTKHRLRGFMTYSSHHHSFGVHNVLNAGMQSNRGSFVAVKRTTGESFLIYMECIMIQNGLADADNALDFQVKLCSLKEPWEEIAPASMIILSKSF